MLMLSLTAFSASAHARQATTRAAAKSFFATTPIFYVNADPHIGQEVLHPGPVEEDQLDRLDGPEEMGLSHVGGR